MLLTIIIFLVILGVLIFVHELGHFLVAKKAGIKVEEFGFGYPPRIWGIKKGETIYSINWIPIGGFVKLLGEDGEVKNNPKSFSSKKASVRVLVLTAGVLMNFLLASILLSVGFIIGIPTAISDGEDLPNSRDQKVQIVSVAPGSPAEQAGLNVGDQIFSINGLEEDSMADLQAIIDKNKGKEVRLVAKSGEESKEINVVPRENPPADEGPLGISLAETAIVSYPWYQAFYKGFLATVNLTIAIILAFAEIIKNLFIGKPVGADIAGPIGIAAMTGQVAKLGFVYILQFTAVLSINLAIINILPFPALDGGRVLFIIIEKIRGRPASQKVEGLIHTIGFSLLILLMVVITFRDIFKFKGVFSDFWEKIKNIL